MPKISSITTVSVPTLSDKLIGTSVGGTPNNQTNNFTLQQLKTLFDGGSPPASPNLQSVLNAGNTATQSIYLTGTIEATNLDVSNDSNLKNLYLSERFYDKDNSSGTSGQYLTSTGAGVQWSTLTISIPTLQQVLTAGNVSDKNITTTGNIQGSIITGTNLIANSNLRVVGTLSDSTNSVGAIGQVLSSTVTGTDWVDLPSYSAVSPLIYNNVLKQFSIQQATSTQNGYLSSADWITFDGKQNAGNYITALTGEATASGPGSATITLNNLAVINKTLVGFSTLSGVVTSADSIISAFGKIQGQLNNIIAGVVYQGVWNASTNTPTLVSGVGVKGNYYVVDVAGNTNLDGITDWQVGDWAIFNGDDWQKVDNTDSVTSVNGQVGTVVLTTDNINEGTTNLYYTNTRARNAISSLATGLTYTAGTGVFSFTAGYSIPTISNQTDWTTAYNRSIISASVTGVETKTLTLTQQDGGTITANWTDYDTNLVTSVFGRVGNVVAQSGDYTTTLVTEGTNLYFTDARAREAISSSATGLTYTEATGDFSLTLGYSIPTVANEGNWTTAYNNSIVSAAVTGTGSKTLTLNQQDGGTVTANWTDLEGLTSVGLSMPSAFNVSNSPLTSNGTIAITGAGTNLQYVDGTGSLQTFPSLTGFVTLDTNQTITGLKTIIRSGDVLDFKIGNDTLYGLKLFYSQNELVPSGEATWSFVNTFNRDGSGFDVTPLSFFRGILVTGSRLLSASVNANLLDYYGNNPTGRYPVYVYNTGVQQFASGIIVGETSGVVNPLTGAISDLPSGVMANFKGRVIGSNAINSNEFATLSQIPSVTGFVPYTGANSNVNLGEFGLTAGQLTLDTTPTGTAVVGTTRWNDAIGSSETTLKGGSVILKNGVDLVARVVNKVTPNTTLTKAGYAAVRVSGAQGQRLAVAYAQANNDANSADTLGLVTETIATNQEGFIITVGQLEGVNTTGALQGETWNDGDVLYLSPTVAGAITNVKPNGSTGHIVVIGYVEYAHQNNGKIYVKVMNGWELDELHNVYINNPLNNQGLFYTSSTQLWENKSIATALGFTPAPQGNYITALTGEVTASGPGSASATLLNSAVTGKVLTGLNVTGSAILNTDSILVALGKLQNQVNQLVGGLKYDGTWNAATNTPTITSGVGTDGDFYIVNVAGTTSIDGINDWQVGDWIVFHTPAWQKVDNSDSVSSVFGRIGTVTAAQSDYSAFYPLIADIKNGVLTVQGTGVLSGSGTFSANQATNNTISITHGSVSRTNTTSTQAPPFGGSFTAVDSITSSAEGHITAVNTKTVTIPVTTAPNNSTITLSAGSGISGGGDFTTDQSFNETITFSHGATSSQPSVNNSGRTFIQDVTLDAFGHVTGLVSATDSDTFTGTVTSVSGTGGYGGLTLSGTVTTSGNITLGGTPSGTWPISISGNAETVDGYSASTSTLGNHIVVRDVNGYIFGNYINMTDDGNPGGGTGITSFITKQGDNYYRSVSPSNAMVSIRNNASGTWGITASNNIAKSSIGTVVGTYYNTSAGNIGGVKVRLPLNVNHGAMVSFTLRVYQSYQSYDVQFSGYLYSTINQWYEARAIGITCSSSANVRMGRDYDGRAYVWIEGGAYTGAAVFDLVNGYSVGGNWESGWEIVRTDDTPNLALDTTVWPNINAGNIAYQSVGYAQSAGYASTAGSAQFAGTISINYSNSSSGDFQMLWGSGGSVYGSSPFTCNPSNGTINVFAYDGSWGTTDNIYTGKFFGYGVNIGDATAGFKVENPTYNFNTYVRSTEIGGKYWGSSYYYLNAFGLNFNSGSQSGGYAAYTSNSLYGGGSSGNFGFNDNTLNSYSSTYNEGFEYRAWDSGNLYIGGILYQNWWSDAKYKDNVSEIENALDKVKSIRGVEYDWNQLAFDETGREGHDIGVIAQEVQVVYPFAVREVDKERNDHVQSALVVDYEKLIPLLVQSIKELSAEVDVLKDKLKNLQ